MFVMKERKIDKVACIGAGVVGHSWATLFAINGHPVSLQDISKKNLEVAIKRINDNMTLLVEKSVISLKTAKTALERIDTTCSLTDSIREADYIQESIFESYADKKSVFKEMDEITQEETILASSSSRLLMTEIQKATKRPERCIIAHPYNPPHLIPLVELVPGEKTSQKTVNDTHKFMINLGKAPLVVKKEVTGYIGNRLQRGIFQEANDIVTSGVAGVEDVDKAMSLGPGIRWAIYGPYLVRYFNTPSHLLKKYIRHEMVDEGLEDYGVLKGKTFDDMIKWRDGKLIDVLRVLGHLPRKKVA
jgi:3-hydroxypropionate dehydrogenase (NADP+)